VNGKEERERERESVMMMERRRTGDEREMQKDCL